ncbi:MAG TPA: hypothetical protein VK991_15665 [Halomonas sp.]|nr:hypothetical protein [Halomonas sp.]
MDSSRDPNRDSKHKAAWQAARQWQERARPARPAQRVGAFRLLLTWLAFGVMMIIGTILGLFFLLIGWAMLPFVRHRMKKRMEQMRADSAQDIGSGAHPHAGRDASHASHTHELLEGDYEVKSDKR